MTHGAAPGTLASWPRQIVVALDGGPVAERALGPAHDLARRVGAELRLVSVVTTTPETKERLAYVRAVATASEFGAGASVSVVTAASLTDAISELTDERLLCMASHASVHHGDAFVGSVTDDVVRQSRRPVLVVGPEVPTGCDMDVDRVDVAVGGSYWLGALPVALGWAELLDVPVRLVHVAAPGEPHPSWLVWPDRCPGVGHHVVIDSGDVAATLRHEAGNHALMVIATAGRRGLERLAEGSVAAGVVAHAARPVLLVCHDGGTEEHPGHDGRRRP